MIFLQQGCMPDHLFVVKLIAKQAKKLPPRGLFVRVMISGIFVLLHRKFEVRVIVSVWNVL
jgi:hypothetical protein